MCMGNEISSKAEDDDAQDHPFYEEEEPNLHGKVQC